MKNKFLVFLIAVFVLSSCKKESVTIVMQQNPSEQMKFAENKLETTLKNNGFDVELSETLVEKDGRKTILLLQKDDSTLKKEGFSIQTEKGKTTVTGKDGNGIIYGCFELIDHIKQNKNLDFPKSFTDTPEMVLRGSCVGLQKTKYLPGHKVYEYPYTPENFPWFYDKDQWIKFLDMLAENRMNSLYLWNGHPFASLVRLEDYPFAVEVDDATFKKNEEMYSFLTKEAEKRGIFVIQMFYNIIVSKPFADHYGIETQDRHRPITPLISDYTRKSITAFIEKYPNVGLLVCLGEAMDTYEDDVDWFTKVIIPGVKDGLKALGRTDEPPVLLRSHDTNCEMVMKAALPLYKNLYTMTKYTGESLTTYQPRGPWAKTHMDLSELGPVHIDNVHILANLEPFRWGSPVFVQKAVQAMHNVHGANALHLYPQASYWDWPYTADKLAGGERELQVDRNWIWYKTWGRYAWNCHRDFKKERTYWDDVFAGYYGLSPENADNILESYQQFGEIAPKLLRRFGITEGNRQTLLLGMFMSQLVNPYKYTIYPGFYESCGPEGEKLIEYVEKNWKNQPHKGELPLDIVKQCIEHGDKAVKSIDLAMNSVTENKAEFMRLRNDVYCYREFAYFFYYKVHAAKLVLDYKWGKNIAKLDSVVPLMKKSLAHYEKLVDLTKDTYYYANSMQTAQRRIPIGGDGGNNKTWSEMYVHYQDELANFEKNLSILKKRLKGEFVPESKKHEELDNVDLNIYNDYPTTVLKKGAKLYTDLPYKITAVAPQLKGMKALCFNADKQRHKGTWMEFNAKTQVYIMIGYFKDDKKKYAKAPKLETDASANDYGQAEPKIINAISIENMPRVNVHFYKFSIGRHKLLLPKGYLLVLGFTNKDVKQYNAGIAAKDEDIDWLFY